MPRPTPPPLSLVLAMLRKSRGWTGRDLETASGVSAKMISLYERGARTLSREQLETLAGAMDFDGAAIDFLLLVGESARVADEVPLSPVDPSPDERRLIEQLAAWAGLTAMDLTRAHLLELAQTRRARQDRRGKTGSRPPVSGNA